GGLLGGGQFLLEVQGHLADPLAAQQKQHRQNVDQDGGQHAGVVVADGLRDGLGAVQAADDDAGHIHEPVDKDGNPDISGAEIDGPQQGADGYGKEALHQNPE